MKPGYFISCENIVVISSKALPLYPKIQSYVETVIKPLKSILFFIVDVYATKDTFNDSNVLGFANVVVDSDHQRIKLVKATTVEVKRLLVSNMKEFFVYPLIVEIELFDNPEWDSDIRFYESMGFGDVRMNPDSNTVDMITVDVLQNVNVDRVKASAGNIPFMCKVKMYFPKSLAHILSSYVSKQPVEYGGRICISGYELEEDGNPVAILSANPEDFYRGSTESFSVDLPGDVITPISFHTHPDSGVRSIGLFIGWPSATDMVFMVKSFLVNRNVLVHFVVSSEGLWVVHLRPYFQKLLYDLKKNPESSRCQEEIINFVTESFGMMEGQRAYDVVAPESRWKVRSAFINTTKSLKISDFKGTSLEAQCSPFIKEDALMFDVNLIKWSVFETTKVFMTFSYINDPVGGLPCFLRPNCD